MSTLGFEDYVEPLKVYLQKYREVVYRFFHRHIHIDYCIGVRGLCNTSVLLSILAPHVALPPGIDNLNCVKEKGIATEGSPVDTQIATTFGTTVEEAGASEVVPKVEIQHTSLQLRVGSGLHQYYSQLESAAALFL